MAGTTTAPELVLGPMLRYVGETEATVWVETSAPCTVRVLDASAPTFEVGGHHYALVVIEHLAPASTTPYEVHLDDSLVWPPADSRLPSSVIRTTGHDRSVKLLFGSCRAAAPHEPPYTLTPDQHPDGLGVDALRAHGLELIGEPPDTWPDLLVLMGDQVYADELSPSAARRVERRAERAAERADDERMDCPTGVVANFEEYTWLYLESWQRDIERWVFSVLPSIMIFDDHDVIDDWNTSASWVADTRAQPWWQEHIIGAMTSYWIYQHLGNLSPAEIRSDGMLDRLIEARDGEPVLRQWAFESEGQTPIPGGYRFSFSRRLGDVQIVMVDTRNGRVLEGDVRKIIDDDEWSWVVDRCMEPCRHLVIASSLPVFTPGGIHALQQWDEAVAGGAWGRPGRWLGEKVRRGLDTEHWPAFDDSFRKFEQLLIDRGTATGDRVPPETIAVLGGDIHFSYAVAVEPRTRDEFESRVHQIVSSPIRNVLGDKERRAMRFAQSGAGRRLAGFFMRRAGRAPSRLRWDLDIDPVFDNHLGLLEFDGDKARLTMERAVLDDDGVEQLEQFKELDL